MRHNDIDNLVHIIYDEETFIGHLQVNENIKEFKIFINSSNKHYNDLKSSKRSDFHCRLITGEMISLFKCVLILDTHVGSLHELTFKVTLYINQYVESPEELKIKKIGANFPYLHTLFIGSKEDLEFCVEFNFEGYNITLETEQSSKLERDLFQSNTTESMTVYLNSNQDLPLNIINKFFFRFSIVASFLSNHYITYEKYFVPNQIHSYSINDHMKKISDESGPPDLNNYNYRFSRLTNEQFKEHLINPILDNEFTLWLNYSSTLRFKPQLIEEKFLTYFRCIERIAGKEINTKLYSEDCIENIRDRVTESMTKDGFSETEIEYVKEQIPKGTNKSAKNKIVELIENEFEVEKFYEYHYFENLKSYVGKMTRLRNHLSHGNDVGTERLQKSFKDIFTLQEIVVILLLRKQGIDSDFPLNYYEFMDFK